jgi:hypothetical protein
MHCILLQTNSKTQIGSGMIIKAQFYFQRAIPSCRRLMTRISAERDAPLRTVGV